MKITRKQFLEFFGASLALSATNSIRALAQTLVIDSKPHEVNGAVKVGDAVSTKIPFIKPTMADDLTLAEGLKFQKLISWADPISSKLNFGSHNDYLAFVPLKAGRSDHGLLWVNHEAVNPTLFRRLSKLPKDHPRDKKYIDEEMKQVGGSILEIKLNKAGIWELVQNSKYNRRLDGHTKIKITSERPLVKSRWAKGTLANCAGGVTPWGTVLTCEENFQDFYGEVNYETVLNDKNKKSWNRVEVKPEEGKTFNWKAHYDEPSEHYGWVVEVDLKSGSAKKLTALGRFAHEGAACVKAATGQTVVYMGDDKENEFFYKFISKGKKSLEKGNLYVASLEKGQWLSLQIEDQPLLKENFKDQTDVLVRVREAAALLGATKLGRPEDTEIDPNAKGVAYLTLTSQKTSSGSFGAVLKVTEENQDHLSLKFKSEFLYEGGAKSGMVAPDNLAFDKKGNLWVTSDISDSNLNKGSYKDFGNNGLYFIPMSGDQAGKIFQVGSAPLGAELTGPYFTPDGRNLFLSIQHPSEGSTWPDKSDTPKSSVVVISGEFLEKFCI